MAGYIEKFILPVIAPPPSSPASYYLTVASKVQVLSSPPGVSVTVTDPTLADLLAMCGGSVSVVRGGEQLPDGTAAAADSLLVITWTPDWRALDARLPLGYPVPTWFIYGGVDLAEVEKALKPVVDALDDAFLRYNHPPPVPSDHATLVQDYLTSVIGGQAGVFVPGGMPIGRGSGGAVSLRILDADNVDLPIGLYFERWVALNPALAGHPLVVAAASLPRPTRQAYVRFETWDLGTSGYVAVPSGLTIRLMDQKSGGR